MTDLDEVADELYGLPAGEFTTARDRAAARARASGERDLADRIRHLRRPTAAAHALNLLARTHPAEVAALVDLGHDLRTAQEGRDGPGLRELSARRHRAVGTLAGLAAQDTAARGVHLGDAQQREVEQTLRAATVGPEAARQLTAGRLVTALDEMPTGLPALPEPSGDAVRGAAAAPGERERKKHPPQEQERERPRAGGAEAGAALEAAEERLDTAEAEVAGLTRQQAERVRDVGAAQQAVDLAAEALRTAEAGLAAARTAEARVRRDRDTAQRRSEAARVQVEAARQEVAGPDGRPVGR
ncbi:hypothetical protein [Kitasatospora sp. NBC_01539]|uniref:hypothetical protein n=1 Tax=Kitasatospora sp. NBC_01539 TaxID=2903577 RepID=UPI00386027DD